MTEAGGFNFVMGAVDALVWITITAMLTLAVIGMIKKLFR
jgi:hypothetical protein